MPIEGLKTHKPTGTIPWPLILLEGEEKSGKSWSIAEFTRSERIGTLYWIDLQEGAAEEYGAIPGADYEVVELDKGDYHEVLKALQLIKAEAERAAEAGEPPVCVAIDSASAIWSGLKDWASERARSSNKAKQILARDPNADIAITQNLWNDAGARWRKIQTLLATFPGIAIVTARGKEVTEVIDGKPVEGSKVWSVESHKELPYTATVWVRMRREELPLVVGARSVHTGIRPGRDKAKRIDAPEAEDRLLEWLVFDALKVDPASAHVRDLKEFTGGGLTDDERREEIAARGGGQTGQRPDQQRPAVAVPTPRQAATRIKAIRTLEEVEQFEQLLADVKMTDVGDPDSEWTLGELLVGRRDALQEAARRPAGQDAAEASAAALASAWEGATPPPTRHPEPPADHEPPGEGPDPAAECRLNAARKGVLASLEQMGVGAEGLVEHFGRPLEQVATRRLTAYIREVIRARQAAEKAQREGERA